MKIRYNVKTIILSTVVPGLLLIAVVAICIWGLAQRSKAEGYRTAAVSMYRRAYADLITEMNDLEVTLSKLTVAGSRTQYIMLLDDVWQGAGVCTGLLSQIPASHVDSSEMTQFLTRVGDYAHTLSTSVLKGNSVSAEGRKQLLELRLSCNELSADLTRRHESGNIPTEILDNEGYFTSASDEYSRESKQEYPVLIYDGPFSESAEKREPVGIFGITITKERAQEIANTHVESNSTIEFSSDSDGDIPAYDFTGHTEDGRGFDISISKTGGYVIWYMCEATSTIEGIPNDLGKTDLISAGKEYLSKHKYSDMEPSYAQYYGGSALISYVYTIDGARVYNDLIKLWIDRQSLEVIGVDARDYLYSHKERVLDEPTVSREDARELLTSELDVSNYSLALIPTSPETEVLCHEFTGSYDGEDYIIYVNAKTGEEEQIFKVIHSEHGSLTM